MKCKSKYLYLARAHSLICKIKISKAIEIYRSCHYNLINPRNESLGGWLMMAYDVCGISWINFSCCSSWSSSINITLVVYFSFVCQVRLLRKACHLISADNCNLEQILLEFFFLKSHTRLVADAHIKENINDNIKESIKFEASEI